MSPKGPKRIAGGYGSRFTGRHPRSRRLAHQLRVERMARSSEALRLGQLKTEFKQTMELASVINDVQGLFLDPNLDIDTQINTSLQKLGSATNSDRVFIFKISEDGKTGSSTHEWYAPGLKSQLEISQNIETASVPWWMERLRKNQVTEIFNLNDLPPEASNEKAIIEFFNIKSFLVVPMHRSDGLLYGFIGYATQHKTRRWNEEEIRLLRAAGEAISSGIESNRATELVEAAVRETRIPTFVADKDGKIIIYNSALEVFSGYPASEVPTTTDAIHKFLTPEAREKLLQERQMLIQKLADTGSTIVDSVYQLRDGTIRFVEGHTTRLGNSRALVTQVLDVTDRVLARQELEKALAKASESEAKLSAVINSARDAIITFDEAGILVDWNQAAERMYGYKEQEALGMPIINLVHPEMRDAFLSSLQAPDVIAEEWLASQTLRTRNTRKDSSDFQADLTIATWTLGEKRYQTAIIRDVTEQVANEVMMGSMLQDINEKESRLQALVDSAYDAIITADQEGNIIGWNPAAERIFGSTATDAIGKPIINMIPLDHQRKYEDVMSSLLSIGSSKVAGKTGEFMAMKSSGDKFPVELSLSTWDVKGRTYYTAIIRDATERKKLEMETQVRITMEQAELIARGIGHDANNYLMSITSGADLLRTDPRLPSDLVEDVKRIKESGDRISELISILSILSKERRAPQEISEFDAVSLIKETIHLIPRSLYPFHKIEFKNEGARTISLKADKTQVRQVIMNLVFNGLQAMTEPEAMTEPGAIPEPGKLKIQTDWAIFSDDDKPSALKSGLPYLKITIIDTGVGIPPENLSKLFQPYWTTKEKGAGLGLYNCWGIVKNHGGTIEVESEEGVGTTFTVYLPLET